jgi:hypothetical protein
MNQNRSLFFTLSFTALALACAGIAAQTYPTALVKAPECRVKDADLQGKYVGECSPSGWAQGKGTALGSLATYTGDFKDGEKHGYGVHLILKTGDRYVGQFKNGKQDGLGHLAWGEKSESAGFYYIGQYKQGKRNGQGIYHLPGGDSYAGKWLDDKQTEGYTPMQVQQIQEQHAKAGIGQHQRPAPATAPAATAIKPQ